MGPYGYRSMTLSPGSLVTLRGGGQATYQVVNVNHFADRVWLRRWPLAPRRTPTFAVATQRVCPLPAEIAC